MDIQETQELFENLLLVNPDFDESLLEKDEEGSYEDSSIQDMYSMFEAGTEVGERSKQAQKASVPEGFVLVEESKISYFYQDSDEPENCCSHERDFDCLGDCIDDGDIIQIDRYAEIHLSKDTFFGTWCECEPKPFSRKTKEFRLFPSHEDAEKAVIEAQEPSNV